MKLRNLAFFFLLCLSLQLLEAQDMDVKALAEKDLFRGDVPSKEIKAERNKMWEDVSISLLVKEIEAEADAAGLESFSLNISDNAINIIYRDIRFLPDSAEVTPETMNKINKLTEILKRFSNMALLVQGHTAKLSPEDTDDGLELSKERACSVAGIIIKTGIFKSEQIEAVGRGFYEPVADNETQEGRALNRRVEISIVGSVDQNTGSEMAFWNVLSSSMSPGFIAYFVCNNDIEAVKARLEEEGLSDFVFAETSAGVGIIDNTISYMDNGAPDSGSMERMQRIGSLLPLINYNAEVRIGGYGSELPIEEIEKLHFLTAYTLGAIIGFKPENIIYSAAPYILTKATAELSSGKVTAADGSPIELEDGETSFCATVPYSVDSLLIDLTTADPLAEITGLAEDAVPIVPGNNGISVTVESRAGEQRISQTYSLTVFRQKAELQSLSITSEDNPIAINPEFSSEIKTYQTEVPYVVTDVEVVPSILPEDEDAGAVVSIDRNYTEGLTPGKNTITLTLSDGSPIDDKYTIDVVRQGPASTMLDEISVIETNGEFLELYPSFSPDITEYRVSVPYSVSSVSVNSLPADEAAQIDKETSEVQLSVGYNEFTTVLRDQLGKNPTEYKLLIERSSPLLSVLEIKPEENNEEILLVPEFSPETTAYSVTVPYKTNKLQLFAALIDEDVAAGASVEIVSETEGELPVGTTGTIIRITYDEGKTSDYTVDITREEKDEFTFDIFGISLKPGWYVTPAAAFYTEGIGFTLNGGMTVIITEDSDVKEYLKPLRIGLGAHFHEGTGNYLTILSGGGFLSMEYIFPTEKILPDQWYFPKAIIPRLETGIAYYGIDYTEGIYHEGAAFYLAPAVRTDFIFPAMPETLFGLDISYTSYISSIPVHYVSIGASVSW